MVLVSSTERAGLAMKFSAHGSDSSDLFMHSASGERGESFGGACRGTGAGFVMTRACSTIPTKWDAENTVEEGRGCDLRRGVRLSGNVASIHIDIKY